VAETMINAETLNVMLKITNREDEGWLDYKSLQNFPCGALAKIDQLWVEASDGKFGFSVQKKIYVDDCGGKPDGQYDEKAWFCFADKVGWRVNGAWLEYSQVTFDIKAPQGHLPGGGGCGAGLRGELQCDFRGADSIGNFWWGSVSGGGWWGFSHAATCKL
jgi:hypothetical protein